MQLALKSSTMKVCMNTICAGSATDRQSATWPRVTPVPVRYSTRTGSLRMKNCSATGSSIANKVSWRSGRGSSEKVVKPRPT